MEIATYILRRRIREVSRLSVEIGTSLQHRVSLYDRGAENRSHKQAVCARVNSDKTFLTRLFQTRQQ